MSISEQPQRDEVHGEPDRGDGHHPEPGDRHRVAQPLERVERDEESDRRQADAVAERREHLCALVPEGPSIVGGSRGDPGGCEGDR